MFTKYNYVYTLYKEKSFTRAAEKLFISQPSLSAAIKIIEEKVGAALFERNSTGVELTQVGEEYIASCEKLMLVEREFRLKLDDIYNLQTGHITVGGTNYFCSYAFPKIINRFKELYPKITVSLVEAKSVDLEQLLKNEQVDIIIDSFDDMLHAYAGFPLRHERILLCVPSNWDINEQLKDMRILPEDISDGRVNLENIPAVDINNFKNHDFILLKSVNDMYERAMHVFEDGGFIPNISFSVDQLNISMALTESGIGASFVTDTLIRYSKVNNKVFLYNIDKYNYRTLYIAHKKNKYCTKAMSRFIDIAREII